MTEERMLRYSRTSNTPTKILAYLLQICRRNTLGDGRIAREYVAEKILRAAKMDTEFYMVSELDQDNLNLYDKCLDELKSI